MTQIEIKAKILDDIKAWAGNIPVYAEQGKLSDAGKLCENVTEGLSALFMIENGFEIQLKD